MDYADWLSEERLRNEERQWSEVKFYDRYAAGIRKALYFFPGGEITGITEIGGGTGWVPSALGTIVLPYTLVDRNPGCLRLAREKNAHRKWVQVVDAEVRDYHPETPMVCAFAVLKHFPLSEWQDLFVQLFANARAAVFTVPVASETISDGIEFTHVRVSEAFLTEALERAGHREVYRDMTDPEEPLIITAKEY